MIRLTLSPEVEKLRQDFSAWLDSNPPPQLPSNAELDRFVEVSSQWQRKLAGANYLGVHFPSKYGGRDLSFVEEAVIQEELAKRNSPQLVGLFGLTMVGPVLLKHGTEEQKERFLRRLISGEDLWCQGFSEPNAGSDLASLKTQAKKGDQGWSVTGQKIWTSFAQYARYCFLLARSEEKSVKHKGLSYFFVPMTATGIEVRPLTQITGDREFNEVFFDNVNIPEENLVGQPGQGWEIAISTLMYERVILTFARHLQSEQALGDILSMLSTKPRSAELTKRFGQLLSKSMAVRALAFSHLVNYGPGASPGPEGSLDKLAWSETFQEISRFAFDLSLPHSVFTGGEDPQQHRYLYSKGRTIAAGSSEIQRNIIAERVLGLPRK